jgi:DNA-binding XRE family transcriptional regulator
MMSAADKIKSLRRNMFLSQPELASKLGITVQSVCYYEKGKFKPKLLVRKRFIALVKKELGKDVSLEDFED